MEAVLVPVFALYLVRGIGVLAGYIANNNAFPKPLSEDEEKKYLELLQKGDEVARNVLIERNLRLVAHVVKKFESASEDIDDLISIGTVGLIKAIGTYDAGKGTRLATYAARCIENEILLSNRMHEPPPGAWESRTKRPHSGVPLLNLS